MAKRSLSVEEFEDSYETHSKRSNSSNKYNSSDKLVPAFMRVLLGLAGNNRVLTKNLISKVIEEEKEKGTRFTRDIKPSLVENFKEVFNYELAELKPNDDYILINKAPASIKMLNYKFGLQSTNLGGQLKKYLSSSENNESVKVYGEGLAKPISSVLGNGMKLLIICLVILNENNLKQSDLTELLDDKFGISWKENESVSLLGHKSMKEYIMLMGKEEYLIREPIVANLKEKESATRRLKSRSGDLDDSQVLLHVGKRVLKEWSLDQIFSLFKQLFAADWDESFEQRTILTINNVWEA